MLTAEEAVKAIQFGPNPNKKRILPVGFPGSLFKVRCTAHVCEGDAAKDSVQVEAIRGNLVGI